MARGIDTGLDRMRFVAKLARALPADEYDAREVVDLARCLTRARAQILKLREEAPGGVVGAGEREALRHARRERLLEQLARLGAGRGLAFQIDWEAGALQLLLPHERCLDVP